MDYQGSLLSSDSPWGLVKGAPVDQRNRTSSEHSSSPLLSPPASGNYSNGILTNGARPSSTENESNSSKELSRSSLSVADSKTIVLSNVPLPRPKHQLEKSQRLSSSNENAIKEATKTGHSKPESTDLPSKEDNVSTIHKQQDKPISDSTQSKPVNNLKEINHKVVESVKKCEENAPKSKLTSTPHAQTDSKQSTPSTVTKYKKLVTYRSQEDISTPADYVKSFDAANKKHRGLKKKSKTLIATFSTATLITTQLGLFTATKRKEPLIVPHNVVTTPSINEPLTPSSNATVAKAVSSLSTTKLAELQSSLINNREKSSETKLNERKASTNTSSIALATSLAVTTNNSHVGQALSSVSSATASVSRRLSPNSNGTNYQEIFHTATRRISESAERGLKQALAG